MTKQDLLLLEVNLTVTKTWNCPLCTAKCSFRNSTIICNATTMMYVSLMQNLKELYLTPQCMVFLQMLIRNSFCKELEGSTPSHKNPPLVFSMGQSVHPYPHPISQIFISILPCHPNKGRPKWSYLSGFSNINTLCIYGFPCMVYDPPSSSTLI